MIKMVLHYNMPAKQAICTYTFSDHESKVLCTVVYYKYTNAACRQRGLFI